MRKSLIGVLLACCCILSSHARESDHLVRWNASPTKQVFTSGETITIRYEFANHTDSELLAPRTVNPFLSVNFRFTDPNGHELPWNGAHFSFSYRPSDFIRLKPNQSIRGEFRVPAACPGDREIEKGGYCFHHKGAYTGMAEFRLGAHATYRQTEGQSQLAVGPYKSAQFKFDVQ